MAATTFVASGVIKDQKNDPRPGVVVHDCRGNQRTTNASGYFQFTYPQYTQFCVRIVAYPQYTSGAVATNRRPQGSTTSYEWQIAGADCYQNTKYCGPNGLAVKTGPEPLIHDTSPDNVLNFSVTYSPPAPPTGKPPSGTPPQTTTPKPATSTPVRRPSVSTGNAQPAQAAPDTTAPTPPGNLSAVADDETKTVKLSWEPSTDDVGVTGYNLERSTDQENWESLADNLADNTFEDNTVSFGSTLYYRVQAIDAAGNRSEYSTAEVTTSDFSANARPDEESTIESEDGVVAVTIPNGAVTVEAFCGVQLVNNVLSPDVEGYQLASGPYEINCRLEDGTVLSTFEQPLQATIHLDSNPLRKAGKLAYYGQKDTNWESLSVTSSDKEAKTETIDLNGHPIFTIMKQQKKKSVWVTIFQVLLILLVIAASVVAFLRFRMRRQLQHQYDDYLHKSRGY